MPRIRGPTLGFKDFKEILGSEIISVTGGLVAGIILAFATGQIALVPGLFILLPGFLEMRGNISGTLAARLGSGLWTGLVKPRVRRNRVMRGNLIADVFLAIVVSVVLGIVAYFASSLLFGIENIALVYIALIAGLLSNVIEIPATVLTTFWLFRHGHDPDNIMGPYVTTVGDIISVVSLLAAIVIVM
jgi:mgtE-like transporter